MEQSEFEDIVRELKNGGFISDDRVIEPFPSAGFYWGFASRGERIEYAADAIKYFKREDICWILLHEEYHCMRPFLNFNEAKANKYANDTILRFDSKIVPEEALSSYRKNFGKYRDTIPTKNKIQRFLAHFGF